METILIFATDNNEVSQNVISILQENQIQVREELIQIWYEEEEDVFINIPNLYKHEIYINEDQVGFAFDLLISYGYEIEIPCIERESEYGLEFQDPKKYLSKIYKKDNLNNIFLSIFISSLLILISYVIFEQY